MVATGSTWAADGFSVYAGGPIAVDDRARVTPEQVLDGAARRRRRVLDCEGYLVGVGCAELALQRGRKVTYHSPFDRVAPLLDETLEAPVLRPRLTPRHGSATHCATRSAARASPTSSAGAIVLVTQRRSDDALYHALVDDPGDVEGVYRVGDCVAPRILADAIFDGHRLAREIDSEDPAVALPWRRERVSVP